MTDLRAVGVVGGGLIGGSLLLALHAARPALRLIAVDTDPATRTALASRTGAETYDALPDVLRACDLVVLALPLPALLKTLGPVGALVAGSRAVVTDVAGLKEPVLEVARGIASLNFVGGHPMAGRERGGFAYATADLFAGRTVALCGGTANADAVALVESMWRDVGAQAVRCSAREHDRAVAVVSHLPYLAACAVAGSAVGAGELAHALAAGGFRDTTRVAEDPTIRHVARANPHLAPLVRELAARLTSYADALEHGTLDDATLDAAATARQAVVAAQG